LYARVSTVNHGQDPELQLRELRQYAVHRGFQITGEFVDHASGSKDSRPELNRLMSEARRRKFDAILVWKLDRWARSLRWLINSLAELEHLGVAFVSYRDNIDLSTPAGRLMVQILGAMGEFEKSLIQERVLAGLRLARSRGKKLGRPKRVVNIDEVNKLRAAGKSWRAVAGELHIGLGTLFRAIDSSSIHNAA
jgi:DNA invertase Pin-like site-specific DNA recombinase